MKKTSIHRSVGLFIFHIFALVVGNDFAICLFGRSGVGDALPIDVVGLLAVHVLKLFTGIVHLSEHAKHHDAYQNGSHQKYNQYELEDDQGRRNMSVLGNSIIQLTCGS